MPNKAVWDNSNPMKQIERAGMPAFYAGRGDFGRPQSEENHADEVATLFPNKFVFEEHLLPSRTHDGQYWDQDLHRKMHWRRFLSKSQIDKMETKLEASAIAHPNDHHRRQKKHVAHSDEEGGKDGGHQHGRRHKQHGGRLTAYILLYREFERGGSFGKVCLVLRSMISL